MKKIDRTQYEKYEKLAVFILPYICPELIATYEKFIQNRQPERYIYENYILGTKPAEDGPTYPQKPLTLQDMITVSTYIALSNESISKAIKTYKELRRVYKRNWFKSIKEEIETPDKLKPRNPQYLRTFAGMKSTLDKYKLTKDLKSSIADIMKEKFNEIEDWRSDPDTQITDFVFLNKKPVKQIANAFIYDLTFASIAIIKNNFNGSIDGFNTKFPTELMEHPIFTYRSTSIDFEAIFANQLMFMSCYNFKPDTDNNQIEGTLNITYDVENLPENLDKDNYVQILTKYNIELSRHERDLDMKDREIVTHLFNMINDNTLTNSLIECNLKDFIKTVYNVDSSRLKHIEDFKKRLQKLKNYSYNITIHNKATGNIVESPPTSLLDKCYIDDDKGSFQFSFSQQWIDIYVQKKYINILTDNYRSIKSPQTKGIMILLQRERVAEYSKGNCSKQFLLRYWRSHMKLYNMTNSSLVKELTTHFTILKEKGILIKDFKFVSKNSAVNITFLPLDSKEIMAYNFETEVLENKSIIDGEFKEVNPQNKEL